MTLLSLKSVIMFEAKKKTPETYTFKAVLM